MSEESVRHVARKIHKIRDSIRRVNDPSKDWTEDPARKRKRKRDLEPFPSYTDRDFQ